MATIPVIGLSPVTFVSEDTATGQQYQIPLSALKFDSKGAIDSSDWVPAKGKKLAATDTKVLETMLADLLKRGILSKPPPSP